MGGGEFEFRVSTYLPTYLPTSNTNTTAVVEQVVDLYVYQEKLFRSLDRR